MLIALAGIIDLGLVLGARFRAPVLLAATLAVYLLVAGAGLAFAWSWLEIVLWAGLSGALLQVSYFAGLLLAGFRRRGRAPALVAGKVDEHRP